jgi:hypothetical protein
VSARISWIARRSSALRKANAATFGRQKGGPCAALSREVRHARRFDHCDGRLGPCGRAGPGRWDDRPGGAWKALPLVKDGKVDPAWLQVGYGRFVVEDCALRTEPDEKGLGLLLYRPEKFGDCQLRVVYRAKDAKSNSGVYVRIDDGILKRMDEKHAAARRDEDGRLTAASLKVLQEASEKEVGPWYAVHHGYEVQICDAAEGKRSRTGAVYSLNESAALPDKKPAEWKEMVISLHGIEVLVDINGKRISAFDPNGKDVPGGRQRYEPKRESKRPAAGYIGLQTHDPGDIVSFKEVSVSPLPTAK